MLSPVLDPRRVAVIGASSDPAKVGAKLVRILRLGGFLGEVFPVNPGVAEVQGIRCYPDLAAIPERADVVLIAVPGAQVSLELTAAARLGVKGALVFSSGVSAAAVAGAVGSSGLRLLGPNTEGLYRPGSGFAATFSAVVEDTLARARPAVRGNRPISIVSQSGGLGFALFGRGLHEHLDFHSVITTGNEADLEVLDFVDFLVQEGASAAILVLIEGLKAPSRFAEVAARAADSGVPLVVMKIGRSEAGRRAAISHTAHLTGADAAYEAHFRRFGVVRVRDPEEMLAAAAAFSRYRPTRGMRAAIVTTSGGAGAWAADVCADYAIEIPELGSELQRQIRQHLPGYASAANPVDTTVAVLENGGAPLGHVLQALTASDEVDAVLLNMGLAKEGRVAELRPVLAPLLQGQHNPILLLSHILPGKDNPQAVAQMGGHVFSGLRGAAAAMAALGSYGRFQDDWRKRPVHPARARQASLLQRWGSSGVLQEPAMRRLLAHYAIPLPPSVLCSDEVGAASAAREMGYPVALKVQSPDIAHKTEAGAVALNVESADLIASYRRILASATAHVPGARIEGVLVQKMMPPGHELVVGVVHDPDFGPLVVVGAGGIYVEILRDAVFAPPPLDLAQALQLVQRLQVCAILRGVRGQPAADLEALAKLVVGVSELADAESGWLDQLDLNPVIVYPRGRGAVAVDALIAAVRRRDSL